MKTLTIAEDFDGYPNGKDVRSFRKGEVVEVSDSFADLLVGKGHARVAEPKPKRTRKRAAAPITAPAAPPSTSQPGTEAAEETTS